MESPGEEFVSLLDAYRQMAADSEREQEALDWCEALIGDVGLEAEGEFPLEK